MCGLVFAVLQCTDQLRLVAVRIRLRVEQQHEQAMVRSRLAQLAQVWAVGYVDAF